jgi:hypothetical protein
MRTTEIGMTVEHHKIGDFVVLGDDIFGQAGSESGFGVVQPGRKQRYGVFEAGEECR